jgi:hypothetical protein
MSILSALKTQEGSLRELAMLPQQQILRMAQMGQLDVSMVPVILNEKAQMVQQAANAKAMAQATPPSVIEQAMAVNAQADAASAPPAGIESLPIRDDMYTDNGMAAGGIVAFEGGGKVQRFQNQGMVQFPRFEDLPRARGDAVVPGSGLSAFFRNLSTQDLRVDPLTGEPVSFGEYMRRLDERRAKAGASFGKSMAAQMPADVASGEYADRMLKAAGVEYTPTAAPAPAPAAAPKTAQAPAQAAATTEDIMARRMRMLKEAGVSSDLEKDLAENAAARAALGKEREDAKNMALLEAGLSIMGGTSPYALQNLAQAKGAIGSYAKSMREIKADEREYAKMDRDLRKADQALKRGDVDKALELEDRAYQRAIQLRGVVAQERAAGKPSSTSELIAALKSKDPETRKAAESILGRSKTGAIDERFLRERWDKMDPVEKLRLQKQGITTFAQYAASEGYPVGGAGGAPAGGRVIDFGSIR